MRSIRLIFRQQSCVTKTRRIFMIVVNVEQAVKLSVSKFFVVPQEVLSCWHFTHLNRSQHKYSALPPRFFLKKAKPPRNTGISTWSTSSAVSLRIRCSHPKCRYIFRKKLQKRNSVVKASHSQFEVVTGKE